MGYKAFSDFENEYFQHNCAGNMQDAWEACEEYCVKCVDDEPELDGEPIGKVRAFLQDILQRQDMDDLIVAMRIVARVTKRNIIERIVGKGW